MSNFAAEPVPTEVEPVTASYLDRQFNNIQSAFLAQFIAPKTAVLPSKVIPGSVIYLENQTSPSENGIYVCIKNETGTGEWVKMTEGGEVAPMPPPPPPLELSGKTWDDFK